MIRWVWKTRCWLKGRHVFYDGKVNPFCELCGMRWADLPEAQRGVIHTRF